MGARDAWVFTIVVCGLAVRGAAADSSAADSTFAADSSFADTVLVLPEVRVDEHRVSDAERRAPTGYSSEVRPGSRGAVIDLLPELLSQLPGVHVQQYGGLGAFSVMSVRGASPQQVAVFLDGMPLTSAGRSVVDLGDLPITTVDRVEVYRGASPLEFGMAGPGGAVNLVTRGASSGPELRVARGSFDTWDARGTLSASARRWSGVVHAGYQGSDGDFPYLDDNATPFNATDDSVVTRANNRFDAWTGLASLSWRPRGDLVVTGRADAQSKRQGVPGLGAVPAQHTALQRESTVGQLETVLEASGRARPRVALRASAARARSRFQDPGAELGLGSHDTDDHVDGDYLSLDLGWARLPAALGLEAGGSLAGEEARLHDSGDAFVDPPPSERKRAGGTLGLTFQPFAGRLVLRGGQRWDRIEDALRTAGFGGTVRARDSERVLHAPQLGAKIVVGLGLELRANWSKADRPPDFMELFGNQGLVLGNPALDPERVESWDAGGSWSAPRHSPIQGSVTLAHFESRARDLILYTRNSASTVRAQNVTASWVRGEEAELHAGAGALRASLAFTWQEAVDVGDVPYWTGKRLPQRPGREGYAQLLWNRGALGLGGDLYYLGDNYLDRYNAYRVASRTLTGAWVSIAPRGWPARLTLEGKNLGDERATDVAGFPLPGRTLYVACDSRLGSSSR